MPALRAALKAPAEAVPRACLQPRFEQLALFAAAHPGGGLAGALRTFARTATLSAHYFFGDIEPMVKCARFVYTVGHRCRLFPDGRVLLTSMKCESCHTLARTTASATC